jgi:phospholipase C
MCLRHFFALCAGIFLMQSLQPAGLPRSQAISIASQQSVAKRANSRIRNPELAPAQIARLIRQKIKYVFVIYQENRSFDSYFGTFPGADGLFSSRPKATPGFTQELINTDGTKTIIHPFRIGPNEHPCGAVSACFAADTDDIDHSHPRILAKMDIQSGAPRMDRFALTEEKKYSPQGNPSLVAKQFGELAMAYEDCDTIPLLWRYASKFVLFDHIFQLMIGPSTPGNLSIIGAQTGATQWVLHPDQAYRDNGSSLPGVPVLNDYDPFWGSPLDPTPETEMMPAERRALRPGEKPRAQINLTFATLPLSLLGDKAASVTREDKDPAGDLDDVRNDVQFLSRLKRASVAFGWYQEGFDREPTDSSGADDPVDASGLHASYITHHNGPQYFGYISNNPELRKQLHGLEDFFDALSNKSLPASGGVFYIKGGSLNLLHLKPADPDEKVQRSFQGDDDHPAYSDSQISEAMVAEVINRIAASPYWSHSAIVLTWDDSEGDFDHVPPPLRVTGPDGSFISNGPRVPLLLISPYARTHFVSHVPGNQASVVKFIDAVFNLTPLAKLPDEFAARQLGEKKFGQKDLGPQDALTPGVSNLLSAFSPARLAGKIPPVSPGYVEIPESLIRHLPAETGYGCKALGIITTDRKLKIPNRIPPDFDPRPRTNPTTAHPSAH